MGDAVGCKGEDVRDEKMLSFNWKRYTLLFGVFMYVSDVFHSMWPSSLAPTYYSRAKDTAWGAITTLTGSTFLHSTLAHAINPVTTRSANELDHLRDQLFAPQGEFAAEPVTLQAADGAVIRGAFFEGHLIGPFCLPWAHMVAMKHPLTPRMRHTIS